MRDLTLVSYKMIRERESEREREREREKERDRERERENNHHQRRKVGGSARFLFHICRCKIEMITSHELLLF